MRRVGSSVSCQGLHTSNRGIHTTYYVAVSGASELTTCLGPSSTAPREDKIHISQHSKATTSSSQHYTAPPSPKVTCCYTNPVTASTPQQRTYPQRKDLLAHPTLPPASPNSQTASSQTTDERPNQQQLRDGRTKWLKQKSRGSPPPLRTPYRTGLHRPQVPFGAPSQQSERETKPRGGSKVSACCLPPAAAGWHCRTGSVTPPQRVSHSLTQQQL